MSGLEIAKVGVTGGSECRIARCPIVQWRTGRRAFNGRPMQYASAMIRAFEPADEDDLIRVWLASTIPGQAFLPEEHWRAMEPETSPKGGVLRWRWPWGGPANGPSVS